MSALATSTGSVNLGQGFPDYDGPREVLDAAIECINGGLNQYPPGPGMPVLRDAIATHQERFWGLTYDPDGEVFVTTGCTEALAGALLGLLDTGDEVVLFEPMYDSYQACIAMAGAVARPVPLRPGADGVYAFDPDELRSLISHKTKLLLLNTPHNPTGKVFTLEELTLIADLAIEHDLIVLADEVYEHLTYDGVSHISIATLPGMWERTLVLSSGGKTFNTTGWKIGWACGPRPLVDALRTAKQFLTYVSGAPFQPAIAVGLNLPDSYFVDVAADLQGKRDLLVSGLRDAGFEVYVPSGDLLRHRRHPIDAARRRRPDVLSHPARSMRCGGASPNAVFYDRAHQHEGRHLVRFAFCKRHEVIDDAVTRLKALGAGA